MRRPTPWIIVAAMALFIALTGCTRTIGTTGADTSASPSVPASPSASPTATATVLPLGDLGPGACWPSDERPSGGQDYGFATDNGPIYAAAWLGSHKDVAERLDRWLNTHKDYYDVTKVVPAWDRLSPVTRTTRYVAQMAAVQLTKPLRVQNTSCKTAVDVTEWEAQVFPVGEWVFFIPGHLPGAKDVRPAFKAVCGCPLLSSVR